MLKHLYGNNKSFHSIFWILILLLLSRILFIHYMPSTYSKDLIGWLNVIEILKRGGNPYQEASLLNYPPFWLQMLFAIHKISAISTISTIRLIQSVLIVMEAFTLILTYLFLNKLGFKTKINLIIILSLVLNPVSVLLNCQHGNFDIFVGFWILMFAYILLDFYESKSAISWLIACFVLGLGILTKTIPFILTPVLLVGIKGQSLRTIIFGFVLLVFPVLLGVSVIYSLAPAGVGANVLGYRSMAGWYGISGILNLLGQIDLIDRYSDISPIIILLLMSYVSIKIYQIQQLSAKELILLLLSLLVFLPTFGPGYSPPYILWFLPLMVVYFFIASNKIKSLLVLGFIILAATYSIEYAFFESHGAFLKHIIQTEYIAQKYEYLEQSKNQALIRMPMFLFYLVFYFVLLYNKSNIIINKKQGLLA